MVKYCACSLVFKTTLVSVLLAVSVSGGYVSMPVNTEVLPPVINYDSIFFMKYHKVGGTTVGILLSRIAQELKYDISCEGGPRTACITHDSVQLLRNRTLYVRSMAPLENIYAKFPNPLKIIILRSPAAKLVSAIFYSAAQYDRGTTDAEVMARFDEIWRYQSEYVSSLSGNSENLTLALNTLEQFDVVGITSNIPAVVVQIAHLLQMPLEKFVYKSAKVTRGRPMFGELSNKIRMAILNRLLADQYREVKMWQRAQEIMIERINTLELQTSIDKLKSMLEPDDGPCDSSAHDSGHSAEFRGQWCYDYADAKNQTN